MDWMQTQKTSRRHTGWAYNLFERDDYKDKRMVIENKNKLIHMREQRVFGGNDLTLKGRNSSDSKKNQGGSGEREEEWKEYNVGF